MADFVERLAAMMPLSPVAYRTLACAAIEEAASVDPGHDARRGRAAAVERERIASHLNWLAEFGLQSGFLWLAARAGALQLAVQGADVAGIAAQAGAIRRLTRRVQAASQAQAMRQAARAMSQAQATSQARVLSQVAQATNQAA